MQITAALVKELRERTGSGMMECKKALVEVNGDIDAAVELMRKSGQAKADKKASRTAAEGLILIDISGDNKRGAILEVNCETDFVAKDDNFQSFARAVVRRVMESQPADVDTLMGMPLNDGEAATVDEARKTLIAKIGENINVRRFTNYQTDSGLLGSYLHMNNRIGVMLELEGGSEDLAKDISMHIAASKPVCVDEKDVPAELLAKEREIFEAQAKESGKPDNIIEKMVEGRVKKYLAEVTLVGQPFVKDPDQTVGKLLQANGAKIVRFQRFEVGEGIEKKVSDFAAEVMEQARGG